MAVINRVRTVFTGVVGAPYYSNHYFESTGSLANAQAAINAVGNFWDGFKGNMTNAMSWTVEGTVAQIDEATGDLLALWNGTPVSAAGATAGEQLPRAVQGLVRFSSNVAVASRILRGRTFVPGLLEPVNTTGGVPSAAMIALLTAQGSALVTDINANLVIWSRTHGLSRPALSAQGWTQWAQLRTRRD